MNRYSFNLYQQILECYEYETRNASVYGNVICSEVELAQGSKERQLNRKRNEDHLQ